MLLLLLLICYSVMLYFVAMFGRLFSTCSRSLTVPVFRLALGQIKPSIRLPAYRLSSSPLSELYLCRQFYSVLSVNSQLHCPSCRTVGQLVFWRAYSNDSRRHRSSASYIIATVIFMLGAAYAGVPLYRMICQVSIVIILCFIYTS